MNQNQPNFCLSKFDKYEIGGKLKKSNCPQNVGEGEAQILKCLKVVIFSRF